MSHNKPFDDVILEEYRALRDESLRCAQIISNSIWIGISGFIITIGATIGGTGAAIIKNKPELLVTFQQIAIILLLLQAAAASVTFLFNLWKYKRIGEYIKEKIERHFHPDSSTDPKLCPMFWECWVSKNRSRAFYYISLFFLQLPTLAMLLLCCPIIHSKWLTFMTVISDESVMPSNILSKVSFIFMLINIYIVLFFLKKIKATNFEISSVET